MKIIRLVAPAILCFSVLSKAQEAPRLIRVWEGKKIAGVADETFLRFLNQVLIPTTVTANDQSLVAYIPVVLPLTKPLPAAAELKELPFTEAALVVHASRQSYEAARARNPWYGPAHYLDQGGFNPASRSASPEAFSVDALQRMAQGPVAFELADSSKADWESGTSMVSVILRRSGVADQAYLEALRNYITEVQTALKPYVKGHFARPSTGHLLEFINFSSYQAYVYAVRAMGDVAEKYQQFFITDYFQALVESEKHGTVQIGPGRAISVSFSKPAAEPVSCAVGLTD